MSQNGDSGNTWEVVVVLVVMGAVMVVMGAVMDDRMPRRRHYYGPSIGESLL